MIFYCPSCRKECELEPSDTIVTKSNRTAYKANCPVCNQDMAEFVEEKDKALEGIRKFLKDVYS